MPNAAKPGRGRLIDGHCRRGCRGSPGRAAGVAV